MMICCKYNAFSSLKGINQYCSCLSLSYAVGIESVLLSHVGNINDFINNVNSLG